MTRTLAAIASFACSLPLQGAVILEGNFSSTTPSSAIVIDYDVVFTIDKTGNFSLFVFDDWVVSDGSHTSLAADMNQMAYQLNGGAIQTITVTGLVDNFNEPAQDITPNDGYLYSYPAVSVNAGDVVTFKPTTLTFTGKWGFNTPPKTASKLYLANTFGEKIGTLQSIPESPNSTLALLAVCGCMLTRKR